MSATRYELDYAARVALARSVHLEHELACAEAERDRLYELIRSHRVFRKHAGRVTGPDERLWERAGLPPYVAPEIKGDM